MTTYKLYIKTHNKTGLKYLGQTKSNDPHKYRGSGRYWLLHLKVHGVDYSTKILLETPSKEEIKSQGKYYSELWDIVNSNEWANLKPEEGDGGSITADIIKKQLITKSKNNTHPANPEVIAKNKQTRLLNGGYIVSNQARQRISEALRGRKLSAETKQKLRNAKLNKPGRKQSEEEKVARSKKMKGHKKHNVLVSRIFDKKVMTLCSFTRWCNQSYFRPKIGAYTKSVCRISDRKEMCLGKFMLWCASHPLDT